jgi:hypothetical protein
MAIAFQFCTIMPQNSYVECCSLQSLAVYASENLEAMNPPLFLRYLNLLMNDAIFLLDEAIQVRNCLRFLLVL